LPNRYSNYKKEERKNLISHLWGSGGGGSKGTLLSMGSESIDGGRKMNTGGAK